MTNHLSRLTLFSPSEPSSPNVFYNLLKSFFFYTQSYEATIKAKLLYVKSILVLFLFFSPVVIKLCACLFLDPVSHYLQTHTRPSWILYNYLVVLQVLCVCFSIWINPLSDNQPLVAIRVNCNERVMKVRSVCGVKQNIYKTVAADCASIVNKVLERLALGGLNLRQTR